MNQIDIYVSHGINSSPIKKKNNSLPPTITGFVIFVDDILRNVS